MLKRFLIALVVLGCVALPAKAQQGGAEETNAAARELFAVLGPDMARQMSEAMLAQIWPAAERQMAGKVDAATLDELKSEIGKSMVRFIDDVMKDAPALYVRHFTASELRDMTAFYRTPTGSKTLRELPKLTAEISNLVLPKAPALQREVAETMEAVLRKRGYQK